MRYCHAQLAQHQSRRCFKACDSTRGQRQQYESPLATDDAACESSPAAVGDSVEGVPAKVGSNVQHKLPVAICLHTLPFQRLEPGLCRPCIR